MQNLNKEELKTILLIDPKRSCRCLYGDFKGQPDIDVMTDILFNFGTSHLVNIGSNLTARLDHFLSEDEIEDIENYSDILEQPAGNVAYFIWQHKK